MPAAWAQTWEDSGVLNLHRLQLAGVQAEQPQDGGGDLGGLDRGADAEAMAAYRGLLAEPVLRGLAIADACARLPQGMVSITVLLVAAEHASMAVAGLVNPPLRPGLRSLWSALAGARFAQAAFALDAAIFDLAYITGPVLASTLAVGLAPAAALGLMLTLTGAAMLIIGRHAGQPARRRPGPPRQPSRRRPLIRSAALSRELGRLLLTAALVNAALTATEVALTAYARYHHALWAAGPLLAGISAGSILGSLLLGTRTSAGRLPRLLACYAGGLGLLTAAGLYAPVLAVAAPLAGLFLGPTLATLFSQAAAAAPPGSGTETQAWLNSIMNGGAAAGAAATGTLLAGAAASRPVLALALAFALALAAAASAVVAARTSPEHAPGPFGRKGPEEEVRRELVDTAARARRDGGYGVVPGRRHRDTDR